MSKSKTDNNKRKGGSRLRRAGRKRRIGRVQGKKNSKTGIQPPSKNDLADLINSLESRWPRPLSKEISDLFNTLRSEIKPGSIAPKSEERAAPPPVPAALPPAPRGIGAASHIDILDLLRRTFTAHDLLFLRRQVTYHIGASTDLSKAYAEPDRVQAATASLLEYMALRAPRGSRIDVQINEIPLRSSVGLEILFTGFDNALLDIDKTSFLQRMYETDSEDSATLANCREIVSSQGGQMWAELPRPKQHVFHMILPTIESAAQTPAAQTRMYKYDITVTNYSSVRKRFGIKKSLMLIGQIEMYVRALVRHPIDIVTAVKEKGLITTIYESPKGAAQSVAGRISQRLGAEEFRIGKKPVGLLFRYQLSLLPSSGGA